MAIKPIYEHDHLCSDAIYKNAVLYKNNTAVVCGTESLTWHELNEQTNQVANALLDLGFEKGTKVCSLLPNSIHSFIVFWGAIKAGGVIVPFNLMLDKKSLQLLINSSEGKTIFVDDTTIDMIEDIKDGLPHIDNAHFFNFGEEKNGWHSAWSLIKKSSSDKPDVKLHPNDSMTIIYTSGTTGTPKGIEHTHFGRLNYCYGFGSGLSVNRYSVAICATPIYASGTWIPMFPTLYFGGKVVLLPKFSPEAFYEAVEKEGGTHSFMVPAQYISLLEHPEKGDTSTLKVLVSAGQCLSKTTREKIGEAFPSTGLYEVYGMTEGFFTLALPQDYSNERFGTVGKAGLHEEILIIGDDDKVLPTGEIGEIVAYGPGMMKGYYAKPALTEETVWLSPAGRTYLRSGDLGRLDEDGFLYICGRKKDMIKSGGINIFASDLEDVLMTHPAVKEVAVVGVPHPRWSETPIAVIVPRDTDASAEGIQTWANKQLAKYQRLSKVILREELPRATYGKIQKDKLRTEFDNLFSAK
ncbi:MAG: class I adenylate-forming enzyme family protein [Thiohalomonadaceae bacterium]